MNKINQLLTRGVADIYPSKEELEKILRRDKKLRLYQGFDPTGRLLHLGHMVGLKKMRQWQDQGHQVDSFGWRPFRKNNGA
jgi:tyrosyl-tRNA synthetase